MHDPSLEELFYLNTQMILVALTILDKAAFGRDLDLRILIPDCKHLHIRIK